MPNFASVSSWTACTITLDSVANGSTANSSTNFGNGTDLDLWGDVSLVLGSLTPGTGGYVELHLRALLQDGTNYADVSMATLVGVAMLTSGASAKYIEFRNVLLVPGTFRWSIVNRAGASFAASGNAMYCRTYATG